MNITVNAPVCGLRVASIIFGVVCVGHLVRLLRQIHVMVGSHPLPLWVSGVGLVITGLLCFWLWKLSLPAKPAAPTTPAAA